MAVNKTMLFGPIGAQVEVPWPQSGMGSDVNLTTETTQLLSGEQAVYRAPVTYRTYNMSWKGGAMKLQPLVDVYAGIYGTGPYYITDSLAGVQGMNLLPAKWAASHLLAHVCNGWSDPAVTTQTLTPEGRQVTFTGSADYPDEFPNPSVVPVIPGQPLYYSAWGSRTGAAGVRVYKYSRSARTWLYSGDAGTIQRTNLTTNPRAVTPGNSFGAYTAGTSETGTTTWVTGAGDGPNGITTYGRWTTTAAKTAASSGWQAVSFSQRTQTGGIAGDSVSVSVWVRYTGTAPSVTGRMRAAVYTAAGASINSADANTVTLPTGVWVRVSATVVAAADYSSIGWYCYQTSTSTVPVNATMDATGLLVEKSATAGAYFDGAASAVGDLSYGWASAADNSVAYERRMGLLAPTVTNDVPAVLVTQAEANANDIAAVKLVPYCPTGAVLTLAHIDLAVNDYRTYTPYLYGLDPALYPALTLYPGMLLFPAGPETQTMFRSGMGTGPVQFTGNLGGKLDSAVIDRIGFSADICEVSRDPNN